MALTAYTCGTPPGTFITEADCLDEGSRIVGLLLVKEGFDVATLTDEASIDAAVTAGNVKIIDNVAGNWARPTSNKKPGAGYQNEKHSNYTYAIPFRHYGTDANLTFWNAVNNSRNWSAVFVFEDLKAWAALTRELEPITMDIEAAPSSPDELGGRRMMEGVCGWRHQDLPYVLSDLTKAALKAKFQN
jgi:hypothetical protein